MVAPIIIAAGISGGASLLSGFLGSKAAGSAADVQAGAAREGTAEIRRQFDITREELAPFREAGVSALGEQQALLGLGTPEESAAAMERFTETPGQQFLRSQQERALLRSASAIGGLGGGNIRTALQKQAFGRAQTDFGNRLNRLAAISGTGQTATTTGGQFGASAAQNIATLQGAGGAARASGILGQQQQFGRTVSNLTGIAAQGGFFSPTTPKALQTQQPVMQPQFGGGGVPTAFQQPPVLIGA